MKDLDVTRQRKWDALVQEAREYFKEYNKKGLAIAVLALKACDIVQGGGGHWDNHAGQETLTRFAVDIGMPYKTLHYWVCLQRNVISKLPNARIEGDRGALRRTQRLVNKDTPPKQVAAIYQRELQRPDGQIALARYEVSLRRVAGLVAREKYEFSTAELKSLHKLATQLIENLDERLAKKNKPVVKLRVQK